MRNWELELRACGKEARTTKRPGRISEADTVGSRPWEMQNELSRISRYDFATLINIGRDYFEKPVIELPLTSNHYQI
jgi:hypothetical protein